LSLIIRTETAADHAAIAAVTTAAFTGRPYSDGTEAAIIDRLRAAGALTLSLVAIDDRDELVGHIGFSPLLTDMPGTWLGIGPLAVKPELQRTGVGSALVRSGLDRLKGKADGFGLVGDPNYYGRFGFAARPGLTCDGVPDLYVQALAFTEVNGWGSIAFHPAFFVEA